jgi:hypothetical protein
MGLPNAISDLIGRYAQHSDSYKSGQYNETRLRYYMRPKIAATDKQIDRLVYGLYGLTKEEIDIVEETAKGPK